MSNNLNGLRYRLLKSDGFDLFALLLLIILPSVIFFWFVGSTLFGLCFLIMIGVFFSIRNRQNVAIIQQKAAKNLLVSGCCILASFILTTISGEGGFFPATADWLIRNAVLHDLVINKWPFVEQFNSGLWLLRAPLGMYLVPAFVGKIFGLYAAYASLWFQNTAAFFIVLRVFTLSDSTKRSIVILIVFCVFSGWDVFGAMITGYIRTVALHIPFTMPHDIGWWDGIFQYSSTITLIYWVPNHGLAGWFAAALLLLWDRRQIRIGTFAVAAAFTMFWSPFASIGISPFLLKAGIEAIIKRNIRWFDIVLCLVFFLFAIPIAIYLTSDSASLAKGFQPLSTSFAIIYIIFILMEVVPYCVVNIGTRFSEFGYSKSNYYLAVMLLFIIPFYHLGESNDFVMRASVPALAILAVTTGHNLYDILTTKKMLIKSLASLVVIGGSLTGIDQTIQLLKQKNSGISKCDIIQAWLQSPYTTTPYSEYFVSFSTVEKILSIGTPSVYFVRPSNQPCHSNEMLLNRF